VEIIAGARNQQVETADQGSSIGLHLADEPSTTGALRTWRFEVYADRGEGLFFLGEITSRTPVPPPAAASPPLPPIARTRIIAICTCPGALRWVVRVRYANEGEDSLPSPRPKCDVNLLGAPVASMPGVQAINERYSYISGAAAATFTLARGQRVQSWAVFSSGAGATVEINAGGAIPVPPSGNVRGDPGGALDGGLFAFVGAGLAGYFVEFKES
jgi:hypothetical protein